MIDELPSAGIPPAEVERRLAGLAQLRTVGFSADIRFVEPLNRDEVRERPDPDESTQR
ncbi:MAG: hypothetical protein SGI72_15770 [Planctomycetota bacterium]|nr:hypothetical protein [Planctomycetota bacterium]